MPTKTRSGFVLLGPKRIHYAHSRDRAALVRQAAREQGVIFLSDGDEEKFEQRMKSLGYEIQSATITVHW